MKRTVFFSWQSDLPNSTNRNFIEDSILKAIEEQQKDRRYHLLLNLDRDTVSKQGTPDIADSIFDKITKSSFFIADISLINGKSRKYRRTPNPNVLLELGFAVKQLGWERVVCVFNTDFGRLSDLPFDLRNRRIITYQTSTSKNTEKKKMVSLFKKIFEENYLQTIFSNELMDYYNGDIYLSLYRIVTDFSKVLHGYDNLSKSLENVKSVLNMSHSDINAILSERGFLGFQLFKSYKKHVKDISTQLEKIVPIKNFNDDYYVPIVRLISTLRLYNKELNRRGDLDKLEYLSSWKDIYSIYGQDVDTSDEEIRLILLKKLKGDKSIVIDFGDFQRKDHLDNLLNVFKLNELSLRFYSGFYNEVISEINQWIDNNNGEFIIDDIQLEIYNNKL